jgi:hypothetical protein
MRIARAAWKGRQDPAGLLKAQLSTDQPAQAAGAVAPTAALAPAPALAAPAAEPLRQAQENPTHAQLLLLLR